MSKLLLLLLVAAPLFGAPRAVAFDFGGVMVGPYDREAIVHFLRESFHLSSAEFERANLERKQATTSGMTDRDFWLSFARTRGIHLPDDWPKQFNAVMIREEMYTLVQQLRERHVSVALLSNVDDRHAKIIRDLGLYDPFDPCILSCEIGVEKPDPRAYEILLSRLNLPPADVVFIDDKLENVEAARKLGIDAIVFHSPDQVRSELVKRSLLHEVAPPSEIQAGVGVETSG